jgi:hypothetical protein
MFMRFVGGGIGHRATDYLEQSVSELAPEIVPDTQEEIGDDIEIECQDPPFDGDDGDEDGELEEVNSDEEVDFGYGDSADSDGEASDEEGGAEREGDDDDDDNNFDKL